MGDCKPRIHVAPDTLLPVGGEVDTHGVIERGWYNNRLVFRCPPGVADGSKVVVERGDFFSTVSQEEADAAALAFAEGELVCFYWNDEQTASCDDPEKYATGGHSLEPESVGPLFSSVLGDAGWVGTFVGDVVVIPAHSVSSVVSVEDANLTAKQLAENSLECTLVTQFPLTTFWTNENLGMDSVESGVIGISTVLYGGFGWTGAGSTVPTVRTLGMDSLESYSVGLIMDLPSGMGWGNDGVLF